MRPTPKTPYLRLLLRQLGRRGVSCAQGPAFRALAALVVLSGCNGATVELKILSAQAPSNADTSLHCPDDMNLEAQACQALKALHLEPVLSDAANAAANPNQELSRALLGRALFFDARLSGGQELRCATCHDPQLAFTDGLARTTQTSPSAHPRNTPTILNAAHKNRQFWDGRAANLQEQPLDALENPSEMASSRLALAHLLASLYSAPYAQAFAALPNLDDTKRFPKAGKPHDPAYDAMAPADKEIIDQIMTNLSTALTAYMRRVGAGPSVLDDFLDGQADALTPSAQRGLGVFMQAGCIRCHGGPNLSDNTFHRLNVPQWPGASADLGRGDGGFLTPSLRNLARTAPYGHNGFFATLEAVVDFHLMGGGQGSELMPQTLKAEQRSDLITFLQALEGRYPSDPTIAPDWWSWPNL